MWATVRNFFGASRRSAQPCPHFWDWFQCLNACMCGMCDLWNTFSKLRVCIFASFFIVDLLPLWLQLNITSDEIRRSSRKSRRRRKAEALCHDHLKIAIIDGFVADEVVSEFVMCLIDGAVSLKKITIVPTVISTRLECCVKHGRRKALSRARERARELVENLRPGIEVEIH